MLHYDPQTQTCTEPGRWFGSKIETTCPVLVYGSEQMRAEFWLGLRLRDWLDRGLWSLDEIDAYYFQLAEVVQTQFNLAQQVEFDRRAEERKSSAPRGGRGGR